MNRKNFELTGVFFQDPLSHRFTAFFAQFPNIIAEGDNEDEAEMNLVNTLQVVLDNEKKEQNLVDLPGSNVITKQMNFQMA